MLLSCAVLGARLKNMVHGLLADASYCSLLAVGRAAVLLMVVVHNVSVACLECASDLFFQVGCSEMVQLINQGTHW